MPDPLGRAFLGVREPAQWVQGAGISIGEVIVGTAAHRAGLKEGDRIISVAGTEVNWFFQLQEQLRMYRPGAMVKFVIERDGKKQDVMVQLGELPDPEARVIEEP